MDPALILQILRYAALAPQAIPIIVDGVGAVKKLIEDGVDVTEDRLAELVGQMQKQHAELPLPE